jgi:hypothetical protein
MDIELNGLDYLEGLCYHTGISCANVGQFLEFLKPHFESVGFNREEVSQRLGDLIRSANTRDPRWYCVVKDLERLREAAKKIVIENPLESIPKHFEKFVKIISAEFPEFQPPSLRIVESFPKPYDRMNWSAMAPDKEDEEEYGIEPGIYIKKDHIIPLVTENILAHELVHKLVETFDTHGFPMGIEEGIADLYGIYLLTHIYSPTTISNIFITFSKYGKRTRPSKLYESFTTIAYLNIYLPYGLEGVREAIRLGRKKLGRLNTELLGGKIRSFRSGDWNEKVDQVMRIYLSFPNDLYVSPTAKYVADFLKQGDTVKTLAKKTCLNETSVKKALSELQELNLIVTDGKRVPIVAEHLLPYLRYQLR